MLVHRYLYYHFRYNRVSSAACPSTGNYIVRDWFSASVTTPLKYFLLKVLFINVEVLQDLQYTDIGTSRWKIRRFSSCFVLIYNCVSLGTSTGLFGQESRFACQSNFEFRISNFERIDSARESTAKFRLALALEFQLRKFCGAESECATGPHKRPVDH